MDEDGFSLPKHNTRQKKRKGKKKASESTLVPEDTTDDESVKMVAQVMLTLDTTASKEEGEVDSDASDTPSSQTEKYIWDNAKNGFKVFVPNCMEEIRKNKSFYACPNSVDMHGESDKEDG